VRGECEELLPQVLLELEKVGGLTGEGVVNLAQSGKPLCVVMTEEGVDGLVGV
jgi:hypothetical protein